MTTCDDHVEGMVIPILLDGFVPHKEIGLLRGMNRSSVLTQEHEIRLHLL